MITQDDIDSFADDNRNSIQAAAEYARRARKGIPADRWSDGAQGAQKVAKGIEALFQINEMLSGAFVAIWHEKVQAGKDATRLHHSDSKYAKQNTNSIDTGYRS